MDPAEIAFEENRRLRRTIRDLVALSSLPAVWIDLGREKVAHSLADVLLGALSLDLIYIRLAETNGEQAVEVVRGKDGSAAAPIDVVRAMLAPLLEVDPMESSVTVPNAFGNGSLHCTVTRFGGSDEQGVLITGSRNPDFPTDRDRAVLGVGANQTAIVLRRRRADHQAHEQREWLRVTLASIGDAVIAADTTGRITYMNPVAEALTAWKAADALGQPLDKVFVILHEQTRGPVESPVEKVVRDGSSVSLGNRTILVAKNGIERPIDDSAAAIRDGSGKMIGVVLTFRDVAEQRRAEQELRKSEARKSAILQTALDCIITMDHEGKVVEFNPAAERTFGYPREQVIGRQLSEFIIPPSLREQHHQGMANYLATGEGRVLGKRLELPALHADGSEFPVELAITRIPTASPPLFTAYLRDLSETKRAEQRRNVRLAMTQVLSQATSVEEGASGVLQAVCENLVWDAGFLWRVKDDGDSLACLHSWHRPELPVAEFEAASCSWTFRRGEGLPGRVWASGKPAWVLDIQTDGNFPRLASAVHYGLHSAFACPVIVGDQLLGVIEFFTKRIQEPDPELLEMMGTVAGNFGQFIERKAAEEELRGSEAELADFFENATIGLHWVGPDGIILRANQAELDMLGYSREEYVGRPVADFHADPEAICDILERLRTGEKLTEYPARLRCKDGSIKDVLIDSSVLWRQGEFAHTRCFTRDVTERKRAEARLREQTATAETLNRIGRLLAEELDLQKLIQVVTDEGTQLCGAQFGAFFYNVVRDQGEAYTLYTVSGAPREAFSRFPMPRSTDLFAPTFRGEGVVRLDDVTQDPRYGKSAPYFGMPEGHLPVRSYLAVPVVSRSGEVLGGLFFGHAEAGVFSESHERLLVGVAGQAAIAIDNARLYQQTQASEERFRQLAENIEDVFWMADPHKPQMLYISPAYEQIWGRGRQSLYDEPHSFLEAVYHDDRDRVIESLKRQASGEATTEEYRIVRPDGSVRWVWDRGFPIRDASGRVYRVAGIAEDISERKHAEQSSSFLAEASATLAAVEDYESTLQKVAGLAVPSFADWCAVDLVEPNGTLRRLAVVHVDAEKVRLAWELHQHYPPDPVAAHGAYRVLRTGEPEFVEAISDDVLKEIANDEEHLRILRSLGLRSFICVPLRTRNRILGILTFVYAESGRQYETRDLSLAAELARRAAVALENASLYHELKEADRRKDEFLATLAHELRNPLAPIRNGLQIMRLAESDGEAVVKAREVMERQLNHMVRLVDDLLDVSRITRNKLDLRKQRVELTAVIHSAVETSRPLIEQAGHAFTLKLPAAPIYLDADLTRLAQVFSNLLNNSAKYTEPGGHIALIVERTGNEVAVRVQDDGLGIPAEAMPRLFQMFSQVDRNLERAQGGLGIGLTLVRRLVEMHGGSVEVHSNGPGRGSEFTVRLPVLQDEAVRHPGPTNGGPGTIALKRRILIVDDNQDSAISLGMMLKLMGNEIRTAHDGLAAVEAAAEFRPDIILLDIGLPKLNGYDACRRIRLQPWSNGMVIVALTGWGQDEDRRRSQEAGFDHHLVKPVELTALEGILGATVTPS